MKSIVGKLSLITNEELETKFEDGELPPPIPPKRLEVNYSYDHSSCTAYEPKVFRPPPPSLQAEVLPILPPKTKYDYHSIVCIKSNNFKEQGRVPGAV